MGKNADGIPWIFFGHGNARFCRPNNTGMPLALRETNPLIPPLYATGTYNAQTKSIVSAFQKMNGILPNGIVDQETWNAILSAYNDLQAGKRVQYGQYPGYIIKEGECDPC